MDVLRQDKAPRTVIGFSANNWTCALSILRLVGPLRACGMLFIEGNDDAHSYPERILLADVVVIHRDFPRYTEAYEQVMQLARAQGKRVIFDIDDLIFELPADHPDRITGYYDHSLAGMLRAVVEADAVTVSTAPLRSYYQSFNPNTWLLQNYLNNHVWQLRAPTSSNQQQVVIGFMGGESHQPDIDFVAPVLRRLAKCYGDHICLRFLGMKPPGSITYLAYPCPVEWTPLDSGDYRRFATLFDQNKPDIAIAPLKDSAFNRCKSAIKFLEYGALGLPGVYSALTPFNETVLHGENGYLARDLDEWESYLRDLIDNPILRSRMGIAAQATIKGKWLLSEHAGEWYETYAGIVASTVADSARPAVRSVRQMQTWQKDHTQTQEQAQSAAMAALHAQITQLEQQYTAANLLLTEQAERGNLLRARLAQVDEHVAVLTQYAAYQNRIIEGLLNGRLMRAIIGAHIRLKNLLRHPSTAKVSRPQIRSIPALAEPAQPIDWQSPFDVGKEMLATSGRQTKELVTQLCQDVLTGFMSSGQMMAFPQFDSPVTSIIIPIYNRAELTLQCLRSIQAAATQPYEIIIVDDASTDDTRALLNRISGATIVHNIENLHFLRSCNRAARLAKGKFILFLNNDAQLFPGAIDAALRTMTSAPNADIGAVGARIIQLDGALQEAGSIVWSDGSCRGYGRGDRPDAPPYMFTREVDYCSGAFLLTPLDLFNQVGGFDERYVPAYYEDSDYCLTIRAMGRRVVYEPNATILHYETASYQGSPKSNAVQLQERNRVKLVQKHAERLKQHYAPTNPALVLFARTPVDDRRRRILFIDDRVPHQSSGSGFPRARELLLTFVEAGFQVTLYPLVIPTESWDMVYQEIPHTVEVMTNHGVKNLERFLETRIGYYDIIVVSRPHNALVLQPIIARHRDWFAHTRIIFDAEAVYATREAAKRRLQGINVDAVALNAAIKVETDLALDMDAVLCVSEGERAHFTAAGYTKVYIVGHSIDPEPTPAGFAQRSGFLFVGAMDDDAAPNTDAVCWFVNEILPRIRQQLNADITVTIVGSNGSARIRQLNAIGVRVTGRVDDLTPYYDHARIFVAPTRYAAGIPMKVHHAAAHGIPIVCTQLLATEVGWQHDVEVLVSDDPAGFASQCARLYSDQGLWERLRLNALNRIKRECSRETFQSVLKQVLSERT